MEAAGEGGRKGWGAALALAAVVLFVPALQSFPLVAVPLAVLLLAAAPRRFRSLVFAVATLLWVFVLFPARGAWGEVGRGWALTLSGVFTLAVVFRPRWSFVHRGLFAVAVATAGSGLWLWVSGSWGSLDWLLTEHFRSVSLLASGQLAARAPDAPWVPELLSTARRVAEWQRELFPALVAIQSLAALGLAWWAFVRLDRRRWPRQALRPLREFRFNDQLVWVVVAGLLLILLPLGTAATRAGANALLFMGALYAVRGLAVFAFLGAGPPSLVAVLLGALAAVLVYPLVLVLTAATLVGLGDTWLDVRKRTALSAPRS